MEKENLYLFGGLAAVLVGLFLFANSGIFTALTGAIVSNATNVTNTTQILNATVG